MKSSLLALIAFVTITSVSYGQLITGFGTNATNGGSWTYTSATSTITGTEGPGDLLFGNTQFLNYSGAIQISLTANATINPGSTFSLVLQDGEGDEIFSQFSWASFLGGNTVLSNLSVNAAFNPANVVGWNLIAGSSSNPINVSLTSATAIIPEPTTMALLAGSLTAIMVLRRRRRIS